MATELWPSLAISIYRVWKLQFTFLLFPEVPEGFYLSSWSMWIQTIVLFICYIYFLSCNHARVSLPVKSQRFGIGFLPALHMWTETQNKLLNRLFWKKIPNILCQIHLFKIVFRVKMSLHHFWHKKKKKKTSFWKYKTATKKNPSLLSPDKYLLPHVCFHLGISYEFKKSE